VNDELEAASTNLRCAEEYGWTTTKKQFYIYRTKMSHRT